MVSFYLGTDIDLKQVRVSAKSNKFRNCASCFICFICSIVVSISRSVQPVNLIRGLNRFEP